MWGGVIIASYRSWRREHAGAPAPLAIHGMLATIILWYLATAGLAIEVVGMIIPWSLGLTATIDPLVARTYFWWFGHPLVYFWLMPAYVLWYSVLPRIAGGRLFSDPLARMVFVLFVLLSTPVGFHHQFADPGISAGWKLAHTVTTYAVMYPSFVTAFTVIASLEVAGRLKGAKGLFDWVGTLPWSDPFFSSVALSMIAFVFGGFGGAINAAYAMNTMVHNTAWIMGHFHVTLGTTVALTFMGATYWLLPRLTGRELRFAPLARVQPYLWFAGMTLFSTAFTSRAARAAAPRLQRRARRQAGRGLARADAGGRGGRRDPVLERALLLTVVVGTWAAGGGLRPPRSSSPCRCTSRAAAASGIATDSGRSSRSCWSSRRTPIP